jgi:hypothetical protein
MLEHHNTTATPKLTMPIPQREAVISIFEKHREKPGIAFSEAHFIDFLLANPPRKGAVRNSFRGLRYFNAFIDEVQLFFGVCFSLADREREWSLDNFVERIVELQASRRGSLASLKNQERAGAGWQVIVIADLLLLALALALRSSPSIAVVPVLIAVAITAWFYRFARAARQYLRDLRTRIEQ